MRRIYIAAPLFTPIEREFNVKLAGILSAHFDVFLPQRDGVLLPGLHLDRKEFVRLSKDAFNSDLSAIQESYYLLAVLDGRTIDEGVSFELGYAYALNKVCIGLKTDPRVLLPEGSNPMIERSISKMLSTEQELFDWARQARS